MPKPLRLESIHIDEWDVVVIWWHPARGRHYERHYSRDSWQAQTLIDKITNGHFTMLIYPDAVVIGNGVYYPKTKVWLMND